MSCHTAHLKFTMLLESKLTSWHSFILIQWRMSLGKRKFIKSGTALKSFDNMWAIHKMVKTRSIQKIDFQFFAFSKSRSFINGTAHFRNYKILLTQHAWWTLNIILPLGQIWFNFSGRTHRQTWFSHYLFGVFKLFWGKSTK